MYEEHEDYTPTFTEEDEAHSYTRLVWRVPRVDRRHVTRTDHMCSPDCFTFEERAEDPTIDDHFARVGMHACTVAHSEDV